MQGEISNDDLRKDGLESLITLRGIRKVPRPPGTDVVYRKVEGGSSS